MKNIFGYLPVHSEFVDSEESLKNIVGDYLQPFEEIGGKWWTFENLNDTQPIFFLVVTGGTEQKVLDLWIKRNKINRREPVYLIAHPTHNSLPASLETLAKLQQDGINGKIFYLNGPNDKHGLKNILDAAENINVYYSLQRTKIGLIGNPSDWLVASSPSSNIVKETWGPEIVKIEMDEVTQNIKNVSQNDIEKTLNSLTTEANQILEPSKLDLENNVKIYSVLKTIVHKYNLDALTIRCFDLVLDYKTTGCFGLAQLNDENYIAGCEGDLVSTVGMLWIQKLLGQIPWMANPAQLNEKENTLWLAHCTVPRNLVNNYILRSHFESGLGVGIQGEFEKEAVTLLRLGGKKMDKIWVAEGQIIQTGNSEHLCRTQVKVKLENGNVNDLLTSPLGNHIIMIKGHHLDRLTKWWNSMINPLK